MIEWTQEQLDKSPRFEVVSGKALKDWVTAVMKTTGWNRAQSREFILERIRSIIQYLEAK